jgi:hypothetical protein
MLVASSYQRLYDGLTTRERARGQFAQTASPKRCKNASVVAKRNRPSAPANSSTSLRSRSFTTSPRLSASKSRSISAWLIGCLNAMQASTSSVDVVRPEIAEASSDTQVTEGRAGVEAGVDFAERRRRSDPRFNWIGSRSLAPPKRGLATSDPQRCRRQCQSGRLFQLAGRDTDAPPLTTV